MLAPDVPAEIEKLVPLMLMEPEAAAPVVSNAVAVYKAEVAAAVWLIVIRPVCVIVVDPAVPPKLNPATFDVFEIWVVTPAEPSRSFRPE